MNLLFFVLSFALFLYNTLKEGIIMSPAILYPVTVMACDPQPKLNVILREALSLRCLHAQLIY